MMEKLPLTAYPQYVKDNFETTKSVLETLANKSLTKLVPPEKKPKALRLLEPRIETVDQERRAKVKRIYAEASLQQGELNALDRAKKKKKF
ncbi:hypothetical protein DOY81_014930 [Sarcophaga bullata]|nr:hypothetical protein DOY81_014930 [Sarcophaga bullata]